MSDNTRIACRTRPRPYDLRRKVLLKNFLREQMTYIPSSCQNITSSESDLIPDSTTSVENEEIVGSLDGTTEISTAENDVSSTCLTESNEEQPSSNVESTEETIPESRFSRFSKLIKRKIGQKKRRGVSKAKHTYKTKPNSFPPRESRADFASSIRKKRSILSIFKPKHEHRDLNYSEDTMKDTNTSTSTTNQSVQTDISWTQNELNNLEQSNKSLREENKLLSESLSTIMSNKDFKMNSQKPYTDDSYSIHSSISHHTIEINKSTSPCASKSNIRLSRSKSVQEKTNGSSYRTQTRSMYHSRLVDSNPRLISPGNSYLNRPPRYPFSFDSSHRSSVLKNLSINNPTRTIVRRASMPERPICESTRPFLRNSQQQFRKLNRSFWSDTHPKKGFNSPSKCVQRRMSMPERRLGRPYLRNRSSTYHEY